MANPTDPKGKRRAEAVLTSVADRAGLTTPLLENSRSWE